jgi:hypothetical protein
LCLHNIHLNEIKVKSGVDGASRHRILDGIGGINGWHALISLPPNGQQVWSVQRQFNASIHTTIEQIVDSLRQKYGPETFSRMTPNSPEMFWIYDAKGRLADPATGKHIQKDCANFGLQPGSANKQLQQDLNKANQQAVPKL